MAFYPSNLSALEVAAKTFWKDRRFDYDGSGNIIYMGNHHQPNTSTSDTFWVIWKLTWSAGGNLERVQGPIEGAWSNRTGLGW